MLLSQLLTWVVLWSKNLSLCVKLGNFELNYVISIFIEVMESHLSRCEWIVIWLGEDSFLSITHRLATSSLNTVLMTRVGGFSEYVSSTKLMVTYNTLRSNFIMIRSIGTLMLDSLTSSQCLFFRRFLESDFTSRNLITNISLLDFSQLLSIIEAPASTSELFLLSLVLEVVNFKWLTTVWKVLNSGFLVI